MKQLLYILTFVVTCTSNAQAASKNAEFDVAGVGHIRIRHDEVGEPIAQPERVEVFVTCEKTKSEFRAAVFRMCIFQGHSYEAGPKDLTIKMFYGRVEPKTGDVVCDQYDMKHVLLADVCRSGKR